MLSTSPPRAHDVLAISEATDAQPVAIDAPEYLIQRYLELAAQRKQVEDQLAYVRAELEMLAAPALREGTAPRGRFTGEKGAIQVRLQPTCVFDRGDIARRLQKEGLLADVATVNGMTLARYLRSNPQVAARLGESVRYRHSVVLTATGL